MFALFLTNPRLRIQSQVEGMYCVAGFSWGRLAILYLGNEEQKATLSISAAPGLYRPITLPGRLWGRSYATAMSFTARNLLPFPDMALKIEEGGVFAIAKELQSKEGQLINTIQALAFFTALFCSDEIIVVHQGESTTILHMKGKKIFQAATSPLKDEKEVVRLREGLKLPELPVLGLGRALGTIVLPRRFGRSSEELHQHALPIAAALVGFFWPRRRYDYNVNGHHVPLRSLVIAASVAALSVSALYVGVGWRLQEEERCIQTQLQSLSLDPNTTDIGVLLEKARARTKRTALPFALHPQMPYCSDVLGWLIDKAPEGIYFERISMNEQFPTLTYPRQKKLTRVEVEFSADNIKLARGLHEALLAHDSIAKADDTLVWSSTKAGYKVTFTVKE